MLQLKPREESFDEILFRDLRRIDVPILCRGNEAELLKLLARKLGLRTKRQIGPLGSLPP